MTTLTAEEQNATIQFLLQHEIGHSTKDQVKRLLAPAQPRNERHALELDADRFAISTLRATGLLGLRSLVLCSIAAKEFSVASVGDSTFAETICCPGDSCCHAACASHPSYLKRIETAEQLLREIESHAADHIIT